MSDSDISSSYLIPICDRIAFREQIKTPAWLAPILQRWGIAEIKIRVGAKAEWCSGCCKDTLEMKDSFAFGAELSAEAGESGSPRKIFGFSLNAGFYNRISGGGDFKLSYKGCSDEITLGGCVSLGIETGLLIETTSWWLNAGGRIGFYGKAKLCGSCNGDKCKVTLSGSIGVTGRVYVKTKFRDWYYNKDASLPFGPITIWEN
ncbi:hypothetical protein OAB00_04500 [Akkermansiaceae bacterium]|nr:hypothetical protein [Akkermansiaceae bacterium]